MTVLGAVVGYYASTQASPVYRASTSVLVGQIGGPTVDTAGIKASQALVATYADLARREPVLQKTVTDLRIQRSWQSLRGRVHADVAPNNAQLITIMVDASSAQRARAIADRIAKNLVALSPAMTDSSQAAFIRTQLSILKQDIRDGQKRVAQLQRSLSDANTEEDANNIQLHMDILQRQISDWQQNYVALQDLPEQGGAGALRVLEPAVASQTPVSPNIRLNTMLAASVGFAVALAIAYLLEFRGGRREYADDRDGSPELPGGAATLQRREYVGENEATAEPALAEAGVKVSADGQRREVTRAAVEHADNRDRPPELPGGTPTLQRREHVENKEATAEPAFAEAGVKVSAYGQRREVTRAAVQYADNRDGPSEPPERTATRQTREDVEQEATAEPAVVEADVKVSADGQNREMTWPALVEIWRRP
jgi:capsular polysaccharide biosynthesis protein